RHKAFLAASRQGENRVASMLSTVFALPAASRTGKETKPRPSATCGRRDGRGRLTGGIMMRFRALATALAFASTSAVFAQAPATAQWPNQKEGDFVIRDFRFKSGETLQVLNIHYTTLGTPQRNAAGDIVNAVILLHGTSSSGKAWLMPSLADELFAPGQPLDAARYFIVLPDGIGRGGSSKPSDGLKGNFPHYRYDDIVASEYRLVTEGLGIKHLRLVMGSSMGGMHTWMWGYTYPDLMDGLV